MLSVIVAMELRIYLSLYHSQNCCSVVFCSRQCKEAATKSYHQIECQMKLYEMFEHEVDICSQIYDIYIISTNIYTLISPAEFRGVQAVHGAAGSHPEASAALHRAADGD